MEEGRIVFFIGPCECESAFSIHLLLMQLQHGARDDYGRVGSRLGCPFAVLWLCGGHNIRSRKKRMQTIGPLFLFKATPW
jgi:hypothetical protein